MNPVAPPSDFIDALVSLRDADIDSVLRVREVPSPSQLAPWSAAVEVETIEERGGHPLGRATLVILHDSTQETVWGGSFRLVGQARVMIDADQSTDPLLGEVMWKTLISSLRDVGAEPVQAVGTVTREISQTFGGLDLHGSSLNADLRCSWTPRDTYLAPHFSAWADALRRNCGVMPYGVTRIGHAHG